MTKRFSLACLLLVCASGLVSRGADALDGAQVYTARIKPVLRERCYACHGALKQEAGLRLDTAAAIAKGGESGAALKAGDAAASLLLTRVSAKEESERMPPEGEPLKPAEIEALRSWIVSGAKGPDIEQPERDPRDHWAFKTPIRPEVPAVKNGLWNRNPIDAFIAAEHEHRKLTPQTAANKRLWLRRVTIDLIGLPPTFEEQEAFLADGSPEAYDKVVIRLLDSPQYGERWGRHWMDIWRYSDWWGLGAEVRNSQKHIWHWRDWIIESLNEDKGYDQMLREMLAADELYPNDLDKLRGGGFLARQYFKFNRTTWLDGAVEHTGKAMLGLTFNCAKCHDHKYDPLTQVEYYQLRAFFEPYQVRTDFVADELDPEKDGIPRPFDCNLDVPTFLHIRGDERNPDKDRPIAPLVPEFLSWGEVKITPVELPREASEPGLRDFIAAAHLKRAKQQMEQSTAELEQARQKLKEVTAMAAVEPKPASTTGAKEKPLENKLPKSLVTDDFKADRPDVWEIRGGKWEYENGKLKQAQTGAHRATLRLKQAPPENFEAKLKYVPTGGEKWKSVGISFDVAESGDMITAYLSSYTEGPKVQVSFKQKGKDVYPPEAAQARKVELNQEHELKLRVQGSLVNVTVDGEPAVAYRLPAARSKGSLELMAFDAQAQFVSFELRELAADEKLVETTPQVHQTPQLSSVEDVSERLQVAEQAHNAARLAYDAIQRRADAQRARLVDLPADELTALAAAAGKAERLAAVAQAVEAAARIKLELRLAPATKRVDIQKRLDAALKAQQKAREAASQPAPTFTPLVGALKTLESNLESEDSRKKPFPTTSTGRRSALARWITDDKNPLTARVAVNHLWNRHFGRPLVPTVFDFGRKGTPPTHPQLLDWLAVEFRENGWSMKHIHRLIVTSQTYRLSSTNLNAAADTLASDPDSKYYWRANPIRMEAQVVRDSLLHLAGELDLKRGGPSIPVNDQNSRRRSLYYVHSHNDHQQFLSLFDDANVLECYRRTESIVPQQALALENSPLANSMAQLIAAHVLKRNPQASDEDYIRMAFLTVLTTEPTAAETEISLAALKQLRELAEQKKTSNAPFQARIHFVQALLNHNDFVTIR